MTVVAKYFFKKGMKSLFHPKRLKLDIKNFKTLFLLKGKWKKKQTIEWQKIFKSHIINIKYLNRVFQELLSRSKRKMTGNKQTNIFESRTGTS